MEVRSLPSLHLLLQNRLRRLTRFPRLLVFRAKTRIFKSLFSTVIGSTFLSGCLIAIPLCVHYLWEVKNPTEHRQYVSVRLPFLSSPFSCQLFLGSDITSSSAGFGIRRTILERGFTLQLSTSSSRGTSPFSSTWLLWQSRG